MGRLWSAVDEGDEGMAVELYIVRHAVAGPRDAGRWPDDSERLLTREGEKKFARAARGLGRLVPEVGLVLSSPYARSWRTAELLHSEAGWAAPQWSVELAEGSRPAEVVSRLREQTRGAALGSAAVVGHEPHLGELAAYLISGNNTARLWFKKGGVARISLGNFEEPGVLRWLLTPKVLRSIAA